MADNTVWLTVASVLAAFTLGKAKDENGNEIDITGEMTDLFFRYMTILTFVDIPCRSHSFQSS